MSNKNNFLFSNHVNFCDKYCKDRKVGCHSSCERYIGKKEMHDKQKEEIRKIKTQNSDITDFEITSYDKTKRRCRNKWSHYGT